MTIRSSALAQIYEALWLDPGTWLRGTDPCVLLLIERTTLFVTSIASVAYSDDIILAANSETIGVEQAFGTVLSSMLTGTAQAPRTSRHFRSKAMLMRKAGAALSRSSRSPYSSFTQG